MGRIPRLIADELNDAEQGALRLLGLGRMPEESTATEILVGLRLAAVDPTTETPQITRLGKEVLGEVILSRS